MELLEILLLVSVGLFAGFASGLIGIGGGMFYVITYTFFLERYGVTDESELIRMVISNSILSTFFAALSASIKQYKLNNFYLKPVVAIGVPGMFASILLSVGLSKVTWYNKDVFAVVFTIFMIPLIWKMLTKPKNGMRKLSALKAGQFTMIGLISGATTALSGLGGSFVLTPILNGFFKINIQKVIGVAVGVITIVAFGTTVFNLFYQTYNSPLPNTMGGIHPMVLPVALGIIFTAPLGVQASKKLPEKTIKIIFIIFCALIIIRNILELLY